MRKFMMPQSDEPLDGELVGAIHGVPSDSGAHRITNLTD